MGMDLIDFARISSLEDIERLEKELDEKEVNGPTGCMECKLIKMIIIQCFLIFLD